MGHFGLRFESFEVYNQYFWSLINGHLFGGLLKFLANVTIPFIIVLKDFWLLKDLQALI
jgi:hypothetical protein